MVPFITKGGTSFRRAWLYFCHDKQASTNERVEWIEFRNLLTDCPKKAWRLMEYTYKNRKRLKQSAGRRPGGRDVSKPCYSYSLSWHPDEEPSREEMIALADESMRVLGLEEHQTMIVCHTDEPHPHVHVVVNRIHPETGLAISPRHSRRKLSDLALFYEQEQDSIRCPARVRTRSRRMSARGESALRKVISNAWFGSNDSREFVQALRSAGFRIVVSNKRLLMIDPAGKLTNPVRHLEGFSSRDFHAEMERNLPGDFCLLDDSVKSDQFPAKPFCPGTD